MSRIKQSFAWWCVSQKTNNPAQFMKQAREIGYEGVELLPRELWDTARAAGLTIATFGVGSLTEGLTGLNTMPKLKQSFTKSWIWRSNTAFPI